MSGGVVAWFTGLPSAGKSTLAREVAAELRPRGIHAVMLDGDDVRAAMPSYGYDDHARAAFYVALGKLAAMIASQGHVVRVAATAHQRKFRDDVRAVVRAFLEVYVATPLEEAKRRDAKGLYAKGGANLPGVGVPYEPPLNPDMLDSDGAAAIAQRIADLAR